jgi:transcriptional regulator
VHPNPAYRGVDSARNLAFAREVSFGVMMMAGDDGPLVSHLPFALNEAGDRFGAHIVRSNPIWKALRNGPLEAAMIVSGPHGYISPDWYGIEDQVPTWNYVAIHLRGQVRLLEETALRAHVDEMSGQFEARLAPKPIWLTEKVDPDALSRMMRMIAPIEMAISDVQGTWKLAQNKSEEARVGAAAGLEGQGRPDLAALMRNPPA